MAVFLACPYGVQSGPIESDGSRVYEILQAGCFSRSLASKRSIPLVAGHERGGRSKRQWILHPQLDLWSDAKGLWFTSDLILPSDWTGFSVLFRPRDFVQIGPAAFKLTSAKLIHVALLAGGERPAYPQTFLYKDSDYERQVRETEKGEEKTQTDQNRQNAQGRWPSSR
jgi:hypothetical protein